MSGKHHLLGLLAAALLIACERPAVVDPGTAPVPPVDSLAARPFTFGETRTLRSAILGQDRTINVALPPGFSPDSATTYPVIYLLDGSADEDFVHIAGLVQFMATYALMPPSIVVGIGNVDRGHDFTYPTRNDSDKVWVPNSGGSADFLRFIAEELLPFVDGHYRTNGHRTLVGQSLGGLLATQALIERPELFDTWILVSPSLWWDDGSLGDRAAAWALKHGGDAETVYIAMANNDDMMRGPVDKLVAALKTTRPPLRWAYEDFLHETHASILHRAAYRAFEWEGEK